jgi:hypothetical protein
MKVAELERASLDYWVARALGYKSGNDVPSTLTGEWSDGSGFRNAWQPSNECALMWQANSAMRSKSKIQPIDCKTQIQVIGC